MREGGCNPAKINDPIIELLLSSRGELSISFPGIGRGETKGRRRQGEWRKERRDRGAEIRGVEIGKERQGSGDKGSSDRRGETGERR